MEKPAAADYPLNELIARRWSPRAFAKKSVEPALLFNILEAARWAASSYNEQPWRYILAVQEDAANYRKMFNCLVPQNQVWLKGCPALMLSFVQKNFSHNGSSNRVALHDVGAASAQLTLQALVVGLFVHQMAGIDLDRIRSAYHVPPAFNPVAALAIGYPGDPESLPESMRGPEREPRQRKPLSEFVFVGDWEKPAIDLKP